MLLKHDNVLRLCDGGVTVRSLGKETPQCFKIKLTFLPNPPPQMCTHHQTHAHNYPVLLLSSLLIFTRVCEPAVVEIV